LLPCAVHNSRERGAPPQARVVRFHEPGQAQ
jgi:hypothetical protein